MAGSAALMASAPLAAKCNQPIVGTLAITMKDGATPMTEAKVNGQTLPFSVSSYVFFSMMSPDQAKALNLPTAPMAAGWQVRIGKSRSAVVAKVDELKFTRGGLLAAYFLVSEGVQGDAAPVIGLNVLNVHDVEYDLAGGAVRMVEPEGCLGANLAYWAPPEQAAAVALDPTSQEFPWTTGRIKVNGVSLRFRLFSGFPTMINVAAAKKLGIDRDVEGHGLDPGGSAQAVRLVKVDLGGELLDGMSAGVADLGDIDLVLGTDFLLSHRVYVSKTYRKMVFTPLGVPMGGVVPKVQPGAAMR